MNWFNKRGIEAVQDQKEQSDDSGEESLPNVDDFHSQEKSEFLSLLSQVGDSLDSKEEGILDAFLCCEGHVSVDDLKERLDKLGLLLSSELIEETLEKFCRYGIAQKLQFNDKPVCFEHLHLDRTHDHLICVKCGRIEEFSDPRLDSFQRDLCSERGFQPLAHRFIIQGFCSKCRKVRQPVMPLSMCAPGEHVNIARLVGGRCIRSRLSSMGLAVGQDLEILNNSGPFIVRVKGTRLALGRGLAQKVLVSPVERGASR